MALTMVDGEHGQDRTRPFGTKAARLGRAVVCSESQTRMIEDVTADGGSGAADVACCPLHA